MLEQSPDQYKTPAEIAEKAGISEEEVWRRLGTGQWPAVALGEVFGTEGEFYYLDYTPVSADVVRWMIAQTHEQIEYKTSYKTVLIQARKDLIQVLTGPDFTPELFGADGTWLLSPITGNAVLHAAAPHVVQTTANRVTTMHKLRSNSLDASIVKAVKKAGNTSTGAVFLELRELALGGEKPFTGMVEGDGLCYTNDNDNPDKFTKNALEHRLRPLRKAAKIRG